jgi:hypothetical protein
VQSTTEQQTTAPSPCGVIPSIAQAYSLNLTVVPHPFSTPVNYVTMWPTGTTLPAVSTLNDQQGMVVANAAIVPAGSPSGGISVYAYGATDVIIDMNGFYAAPTDLSGNTAVGGGALLTNTAGIQNTATGNDALQANTTGNDNTATGANAMQYNTTGGINTANGFSALRNNTTGTGNTASGASALINNTTGNNNTAGGFSALYANTTGTGNTASGFQSLMNNETGSGNIAIGNAAGSNFVGGSNNIHIGNVGTSSDNKVIKIGTQGTQTATSIAGVYGGSPNISTLQLVCVDANGILGNLGCGSTPSSRRFKEQIADMGDSSNKLLQLRPVTFLYKPEYNDGSHALQYGLIAEEVAKLYPDMVGYDKDGQPNSVKYQSLTPMLLNEVQKQNARLQNEVRIREAENRKLEDRVAALEALLSSLATPAVRPAGSQ